MGFFSNNKLIHGFKIEGDPEGLKALRRMTENEVHTLFKEAHEHNLAYFQYKTRHFEIAHVEDKTSSFMSEIDRYVIAETKGIHTNRTI